MTIHGPGQSAEALAGYIQDATAARQEVSSESRVAQQSAQASSTLTATPAMAKRLREASRSASERLKKTKTSKADQPGKIAIDDIKKEAGKFNKRNLGFEENELEETLDELSENSTAEEILNKLQEKYADEPAKITQAFRFLLNTTNSKLHGEVDKASRIFGTSMVQAAEQMTDLQTLQSTMAEVVDRRPDAPTLFASLKNQYGDYESIKNACNWMLHKMAQETVAEGVTMEPAKLQNLLGELKTIQALFGLFNNSQVQVALVAKLMKTQIGE